MLLDDKRLMISNYEKCLYCHLLGYIDSQANRSDQTISFPNVHDSFSNVSCRYRVVSHFKLNEQTVTREKKKHIKTYVNASSR